jgi:competence protein ComEC
MVVESLRRSGLAHLVAVSGSNVAIVLTAVAAALRHIALWTRVGVALIALVLFAIVVGPEPSVLRAALMGGIGLVALVAGRRARPMNALGLALVVLVGARPAMVGSVGLHLSAAATAGIVAWSHPLAARLSRLPRPVALALGATLAAQVAVAPLVVGVFGRLSLAGPAANLVAAPAVPPATVLGLGAAVAGAVHAPAGRVAAWLAEPFVAWIMMVGTWFGAQEWSEVEMGRAWGAWLLLLLVAAAARTLVRRARG